MKKILLLPIILLGTCLCANAQTVRFSNITEASVGFQVGKTARITSFSDGKTETQRTRYKFPAPRLATSFGITLFNMWYLGPGVSYTFQPRDDDNGYAHQISAFGQTRLHIGKAAVRPFIDFKGGYHFASWEQTSNLFDRDWYKWDGFFLEPALGISFAVSEHAALNGSIGYQFVNMGNRIEQSIVTDSGEPIANATLHEKYHQLLLTIGFTFQ